MVFFFQKAKFSFIKFSLLQFFYPLCSLISAISFSLLTLWLAGWFSTTEAYLVLVVVGAFFLEFKTEPLHIAGQALCYTVQHGQDWDKPLLCFLLVPAFIAVTHTITTTFGASHTFWCHVYIVICHDIHMHVLVQVYIFVFILGQGLTLSPQLASSSQWSLSFVLQSLFIFLFWFHCWLVIKKLFKILFSASRQNMGRNIIVVLSIFIRHLRQIVTYKTSDP